MEWDHGPDVRFWRQQVSALCAQERGRRRLLRRLRHHAGGAGPQPGAGRQPLGRRSRRAGRVLRRAGLVRPLRENPARAGHRARLHPARRPGHRSAAGRVRDRRLLLAPEPPAARRPRRDPGHAHECAAGRIRVRRYRNRRTSGGRRALYRQPAHRERARLCAPFHDHARHRDDCPAARTPATRRAPAGRRIRRQPFAARDGP